MSQWVGDVAIDTKQSCDQHRGSSTQDPGKPIYFIQDPGGRKMDISPRKLNLATHHWIKLNISNF